MKKADRGKQEAEGKAACALAGLAALHALEGSDWVSDLSQCPWHQPQCLLWGRCPEHLLSVGVEGGGLQGMVSLRVPSSVSPLLTPRETMSWAWRVHPSTWATSAAPQHPGAPRVKAWLLAGGLAQQQRMEASADGEDEGRTGTCPFAGLRPSAREQFVKLSKQKGPRWGLGPQDLGLMLEIHSKPRRKESGQGLCSQVHLGQEAQPLWGSPRGKQGGCVRPEG